MQTKPKPLLITAAVMLFLLAAHRLSPNIILSDFATRIEFTSIIQILAYIAAGVIALVLMKKGAKKYGISLIVLVYAQLAGKVLEIFRFIEFFNTMTLQIIITQFIISAIYIIGLLLAYFHPKIPFCFIILAINIFVFLATCITEQALYTHYLNIFITNAVSSLIHTAATFLITFQIWRDARNKNQII